MRHIISVCVLVVLALTLASGMLMAGPHDNVAWVWRDSFDSYPLGNLGVASNGIWGGGAEFQVANGGCPANPTRCVETTGATSGKSPTHSLLMNWEPKGGTFYFHCRIMSPRGQSGGSGQTFCISIRDEFYMDIARWEADERSVTPVVGDESVSGASTSLTAGVWYELDVVHDLFTKETRWYVNGALKLSFNLRDLANKANITSPTVKWIMFNNNGSHSTYKLDIDDIRLGAKLARNVPTITMPTDNCSVGGSGPFVFSPFDCVTETPTLHWKVDPHVGYEVKVFDYNTSNPDGDDWYMSIKQPNTTKQHFTADYMVKLIEGQVYWALVRVKIDGVWQPWSPSGRDFIYSSVTDLRPEAPVIESPPGGSWVRPLNVLPTFTWSVPGAIPHNQARVVVGTYPQGVDYWDTDWMIIGDSLSLQTLDPRPRDLVEGQVYYARMRVRNGCQGCDDPNATWCDGDGPYSNSSHVVKATNKPIVTEVSPAGGATVHTTTPVITWPADIGVVAPVTQVQVRVTTDPDATPTDGSRIKYDATFAASGDPGFHAVTTPLPTGAHLWAFVRLANSAGWGPWSPNMDPSNWPYPSDNGGFYVDTGLAGIGPVTAFAATAASGQVSLSWTNPADPAFTGAMIRYKTTGYPTSISDGTLVIDKAGSPGAPDTHVHAGLANGTRCYYAAFAHDGAPHYSTRAYASATPAAADASAPAAVTSFATGAGDGEVYLYWHNPPTADFTGVMIRHKAGSYPTSITDGTLVIDKPGLPGTDDTYTHTGLSNGTTYYYSAFAHDAIPNHSSRATATGRPAAPDTAAPANASLFAAVSGTQQVTLSWRNPSDTDFTGLMIRYKSTGYPTSATDGSLATDKSGTPGANDNYIHTGLPGGVPCYYKAFSHDGVPNYSAGVTATATPGGGSVSPVLNVKTAGAISIDGSTSDWNIPEFVSKARGGLSEQGDIGIVGYDSGTLYYAGYWNGGALPTSAADHTAKFYTRHDASYLYLLVRCDDSDMRYSDPVGSNWANDCVEFYIDPSHNGGSTSISNSASDIQLVIDANNQKNVYMTTPAYAAQVLAGVNSAVVRDATGWWLEARVAKAALDPDMPATGAVGIDLNFRDNDNNNDAALTTVYSWADNTAGSGFPSKIPDKWGDLLHGDASGPGPVTAFAAVRGDREVRLNWHTPSDSDFIATMIRYKTTGYPTGLTDGTLLTDEAGPPNSDETIYHLNLTNGTPYYYAAFAHDSIPNYSTAATATATPADTTAPGPVTGFTVIAGNGLNNLSWSNPATADLAGVKILCKTAGYPSGPDDGDVVFDSAGTSCRHLDLANGTTYNYAAYAYDEVPNYSAAAQANGAPAYFGPVQAKLCADSTPVTLTVGVVSAVGPDWFYAQCADATCGVCGIKVQRAAHGLLAGQACGAKGTVVTDPATGERCIVATWAAGEGSSAAAPRAMTNLVLGGGDWNYSPATGAGQKGIAGAAGANNLGLFVRAWGRVTQRDTTGLQYLYIDDGSRLLDGTQTGGANNIGVRIKADPTAYSAGSFVIVTGISSSFKDGSGAMRRQIVPVEIRSIAP